MIKKNDKIKMFNGHIYKVIAVKNDNLTVLSNEMVNQISKEYAESLLANGQAVML